MDGGLLFFSVIIPAHNEEAYVGNVLTSLKDIDYPRDKFEVIVVENGSTDRTNDIIREYAPASFKVVRLAEPGVSRAKNRGLDLVSQISSWVIVLDADTYPGTSFLRELDHFLEASAGRNLGTGMVSLLPAPDSRLARAWYHFFNLANYLTHTTRSIQCIRRDLLKDLRYDETLTFGEDTKMLQACSHTSRHFYLRTRSVVSSTRRFQQNGWIGQLFNWIYLASLPYSKKQSARYTAIR